MAEKKEGLDAALDVAMQAVEDDEPIVEAQAPLPFAELAAPIEAPAPAPAGAPGRPGRPAGSRNKRTEEWVAYLLGRYRSPLVMLAETYSRTTASLAAELQCKKSEAFDIQVKAATALAPYLHQKLPQAVEVDITKNEVVLHIDMNGAMQTGADALELKGAILDDKSDT